MENGRVYDPQSIGGTHVIYYLHDATDPERYGGLPKNPTIVSVELYRVEVAIQAVLGAFALFGGLGVLFALCKPLARDDRNRNRRKRRPRMANRDLIASTKKARRTFDSIGRTEVYRGELLRHPVYTSPAALDGRSVFLSRLVHRLWNLFCRGLFPLVPLQFSGGGALSRILHPYFGVAFVFFFLSCKMLNGWPR